MQNLFAMDIHAIAAWFKLWWNQEAIYLLSELEYIIPTTAQGQSGVISALRRSINWSGGLSAGLKRRFERFLPVKSLDFNKQGGQNSRLSNWTLPRY